MERFSKSKEKIFTLALGIAIPKISDLFRPSTVFYVSFVNSEAAVRRCSSKKLFLKQYSQKNAFVGVFFYEVVGLKACNFIKKGPQHRCFTVNIAKFLRIPF